MNKLKERFTKWYVNKGYLFGYDFTDNPTENDIPVCKELRNDGDGK